MKKLLMVAAALLLAAVTFTACNSDSDTDYTALLLAKNSSTAKTDYTENFKRGFWKYTITVNGTSDTKYFCFTELKDSNKKPYDGLLIHYVEGLVFIGNSVQCWAWTASDAEQTYIATVRDSKAFTWEALYNDAVNGLAKFEKVMDKSEFPDAWVNKTWDGFTGVYALSTIDETMPQMTCPEWLGQ